MTDYKDYIDWFRASTTYINAHRGKTFVVLLTGEAVEDPNFSNIIYDMTLLHSLGVKLVLVHGARPQISSALSTKSITSKYHDQIRITQSEAISEVIAAVGTVSTKIEAQFSMGLTNSPMAGSNIRVCRGNFVTAKPYGIHEGVDYHLTGKVRKIHSTAINQHLDNANIVVLSNLGYSLTGEVFNLTAEEVATQVAISLNADKLILLTPVEGILNTEGELVPSLSESDAVNQLSAFSADSSTENQAMHKALQAALVAYKAGVHRSHLISYKSNGAMLQELFTRDGKGSLISGDNFDLLRQASINDVAGILALITPLEKNGTLVIRSRELLENEIGNFQVVELEGSVIACAAFYPLTENSVELACIAIDEHYRNKGYGDRLLNRLEANAKALGFKRVFVLTTVTDHWFIEKGFQLDSIDSLPDGKKLLYNYQRNSKVLSKNIE